MQRNNNKSVTYTEEVLREALRKSDLTFKRFSFEEALDGMRLMFDYIISETKEEEVFAINLPKFGILYKNLHFLRNTFRQNAYSDEKIEKLKKQIMELVYFNDQNGMKSVHNRVPLTWGFDKEIKKEYEIRDSPTFMSNNSLEILAAVEHKQNNR